MWELCRRIFERNRVQCWHHSRKRTQRTRTSSGKWPRSMLRKLRKRRSCSTWCKNFEETSASTAGYDLSHPGRLKSMPPSRLGTAMWRYAPPRRERGSLL
eukprot:Rmarinus@m.20948